MGALFIYNSALIEACDEREYAVALVLLKELLLATLPARILPIPS